MSFVTNLRCGVCHAVQPKDVLVYTCPQCGGILEADYDYDAMRAALSKERIASRSPSILERWREFLPIEDERLIERVSLGERVSPLLKARKLGAWLGMDSLWIKNESAFPTGSLKDRSMPLVTLKALEFGAKTVSIVSSGNAAVSLSAYAARAGLEAVVFVSCANDTNTGADDGASNVHLEKCRAYGARIHAFDVPYSEAERIYAEEVKKEQWFDCNGFINPWRLEGKKTLAHECCESLGWTAPDAVFMPIGYGTGFVSAIKGFAELRRLGWIDELPRVYGVQPAACAPFVRAFNAGRSRTEPVDALPTVAASIAANDPSLSGERVLRAAREAGGVLCAVTEQQIIDAQTLLARQEGILVESSAAVPLAALINALDTANLPRDTRTIISVTGRY
jgi:threonine synthase